MGMQQSAGAGSVGRNKARDEHEHYTNLVPVSGSVSAICQHDKRREVVERLCVPAMPSNFA